MLLVYIVSRSSDLSDVPIRASKCKCVASIEIAARKILSRFPANGHRSPLLNTVGILFVADRLCRVFGRRAGGSGDEENRQLAISLPVQK